MESPLHCVFKWTKVNAKYNDCLYHKIFKEFENKIITFSYELIQAPVLQEYAKDTLYIQLRKQIYWHPQEDDHFSFSWTVAYHLVLLM